MEMTSRILAMTAAGILTLGGCVEEGGKEGPEMRFEIAYPGMSRMTETSFEEGDCVGVFVKEEEKPLEVSGNTVNNEAVAFEGNEWTPRRALYWEEGTYDVVGYYPYQERVESVEDLRFAVRLDQSVEGTDGGLGGYEASDFLWAVRENVRAEDGAVELRFAHRMSKLVVRLVPTEDYEGEIPRDAVVRVHGTVTEATVDLEAGVVTKYPYGEQEIITARKVGDGLYEAIVVPQRLDYNRPLVEVIADGVSYMYETRFVFRSGVEHTLTVYMSSNPEQTKIEIGGEIEGWN